LTLVLDTSALVKRYVAEMGSETVARLMAEDLSWAASSLCRVEAEVTLCQRGFDVATLAALTRDLEEDWDLVLAIPVDGGCLEDAARIGCDRRVRTLDAIHLAAALRLPDVTFATADHRQAEAARDLGLTVVDVLGP
jgi:predicted nucleic acid-binding protein